MKRKVFIILTSILILAGIIFTVLYSIGDRVIEESILMDLADKDKSQPGNNPQPNGESSQGQNGENSPGQNVVNGKGNGLEQEDKGNQAGNAEQSGTTTGANTEVDNYTGKPGADNAVNNSDPAEPDKNSGDKKGDSRETVQNKPISEPKPETAKDTSESLSGSEKLTQAEVQEIKEKVTAPEKLEAAALLLKRLTATEISKLRSFLEGGLTKEEIVEAKKLAYSKFTDEEITHIKEMYRKYIEQ